MHFLDNKKYTTVLFIVLIAVLIYLCYRTSKCNCALAERYPKYKNPERFNGARAYEQGPYMEGFSMDFSYEQSSPPVQDVATPESPFLGYLPSEMN